MYRCSHLRVTYVIWEWENRVLTKKMINEVNKSRKEGDSQSSPYTLKETIMIIRE